MVATHSADTIERASIDELQVELVSRTMQDVAGDQGEMDNIQAIRHMLITAIKRCDALEAYQAIEDANHREEVEVARQVSAALDRYEAKLLATVTASNEEMVREIRAAFADLRGLVPAGVQ